MKKSGSGASSEENKESQNPYHIKDSGFLIFTEIIFGSFLLKTAVAIPLKKSKKRKTIVFLRGNCFSSRFFTL